MTDDRFDLAARGDGTVFEPTLVRPARGPRVLVAIVIAGIGTLIAIGALDQQPAPNAPLVARASDAASTLRAQPTRSSRPPQGPVTPRLIHREAGAVMELDVRPAGSHLFIHGDVFSLAVTRVRVRLEDGAGHVADVRSVDVPGGSRGFRLGAVPRFDVHFLLPDEVQADGFIVSATALDSKGDRVATLQHRVPRASEAM